MPPRILQVRFGVNAWVGLRRRHRHRRGWSALAIGFLSFRSGLRGSYFALVTLAFAEVFRIARQRGRVHRRRGGHR